MRALPFLIVGFLSIGTAMAEPVPFSIPWFEIEAHDAARLEAIKTCRNDNRYYENKETRPICDNAEMASSRIYSRRMKQGLNGLNTLRWWKENRDLRAAALQACQRRAPYDQNMLQYCDLAREAEQLSPSSIRSRVRS